MLLKIIVGLVAIGSTLGAMLADNALWFFASLFGLLIAAAWATRPSNASPPAGRRRPGNAIVDNEPTQAALRRQLSDVSFQAQRLAAFADSLASFEQETDALSQSIGWVNKDVTGRSAAHNQGRDFAKAFVLGNLTADEVLKRVDELTFSSLSPFLTGFDEGADQAASQLDESGVQTYDPDALKEKLGALGKGFRQLKERWQPATGDMAMKATEAAATGGMDELDAIDRYVGIVRMGERRLSEHEVAPIRERANAGDVFAILLLLKLQLSVAAAFNQGDLEMFMDHDDDRIRALVRDLIELERDYLDTSRFSSDRTRDQELRRLQERARSVESNR